MLEQNGMKPLYEQLMDAIIENIRNQTYKRGDKLPTETELESIYKVSRITVRRAVKELCDKKILVKKQGKGTFVLDTNLRLQLNVIKGFHDTMEDLNKHTSSQMLSLKKYVPSMKVAGYLSLPPESQIIEIKRLLSSDGTEMFIDTCYIPPERYPDIENYLKGDFSVYQILTNFYHVNMVNSEKVIKVRKASKEEAGYLHCQEGDPVFDIFKIVYDENHTPIHFSISILNGANTSYVISTDNKEHLKIKNPANKAVHIISQ